MERNLFTMKISFFFPCFLLTSEISKLDNPLTFGHFVLSSRGFQTAPLMKLNSSRVKNTKKIPKITEHLVNCVIVNLSTVMKIVLTALDPFKQLSNFYLLTEIKKLLIIVFRFRSAPFEVTSHQAKHSVSIEKNRIFVNLFLCIKNVVIK